MSYVDSETDTEYPAVTELTKPQRRVLGVLVEKAFTTPEYYPLTPKALIAGCNQKSNRSPLCHYDEDDIADAIDELRKLGLAAVVHTESGRTERYRHYMRRRFTFTEPQLAILTELLLRGKQSMGELRARASRMVPIAGLEELRGEVRGLQQMGLVQANGPLERRGIEVDHNMYLPSEGRTLEAGGAQTPSAESPVSRETVSPAVTTQNAVTPVATGTPTGGWAERLTNLEAMAERQSMENRELRDALDSMKEEVQQLAERFDELRQDLGG